jgi:ABC-type nickel/cobalt efflux system permease component RcnA
MNKVYRTGEKFFNSKAGIVFSLTCDVLLIAIMAFCLRMNIVNKQPWFFTIAPALLILMGLYNIVSTLIKISRKQKQITRRF